jgi:hypothetical protein
MTNIILRIYLQYKRSKFRKDNPVFKFSRQKQEKIIRKFGVPTSNVERSFYQYRVQEKYKSIFEKLTGNLLSIFAILVLELKISTSKNSSIQDTKVKNVFTNDAIIKVVSKEYLEDFIVYQPDSYESFLTNKAEILYKQIRIKYYFHFFFRLKILLKLVEYSNIVAKHSPINIYSSCEYSFTSSVLTELCNLHQIFHINVMHGEKLYFIRDSFFSFDKMIVWEEDYIQLFSELLADVNEFIVIKPVHFKSNSNNVAPTNDFVYYLGAESKSQLGKIKNNLQSLRNKGYIVKIRLHPIYTNKTYAFKIFDFDWIESGNDVNIVDSISNAKNIISLYSTVLYQGYLNNKTIIIDDVTDLKRYNTLKTLNYFIMQENYVKLSEVLRSGGMEIE